MELLTAEEQIVAPALGLIRSLLGLGLASRGDREHTNIEAAVDVCSEDELDRSGRLVIRLSDPPIDVLVIRTRRRVFAVENRCPHLGVSLEGGNVRGRTITCTTHGRRFDLASGRCATSPGRPGRIGPACPTFEPTWRVASRMSSGSIPSAASGYFGCLIR